MSELKGTQAKDLMVDIISVTSKTTVLESIDVMLEKKSKGILVVDGGSISGIVTDFDFIRILREGKVPTKEDKISDIMTREVVFTHSNDSLTHIASLMFEHNIRFLPVVAQKKPIGIITRREIGRIFAAHYGQRYKARDLMTSRYSTFHTKDSIERFFRKVREYSDKYSIVLADEKVVGVVTPTNILRHLRLRSTIDKNTSIEELMTPEPYVVGPDERADVIANMMISRDFSGVPIVDDRLEGIIRYSCFLQFLGI